MKLQDLSHTVEGLVVLGSANGKSLAVIFDEGIPAPFGVLRGKQALLLSWNGRVYTCILTGRGPIHLYKEARRDLQ